MRITEKRAQSVLFLALIAVSPAFADPPSGRFYGVRIVTSSGPMIGYVDKLDVPELYAQIYGSQESTRIYTDEEVISLLKKQKRVEFFSGVFTLRIPFSDGSESVSVLVSTGFCGPIQMSNVREISRHPGPEDDNLTWGFRTVPPRLAELLMARTPIYSCRNVKADFGDDYWISFNGRVSQESLKPLCDRPGGNYPPIEEEVNVLKNLDVFHFVIATD